VASIALGGGLGRSQKTARRMFCHLEEGIYPARRYGAFQLETC
jgi:hypothetical protein